MWRCLILVLSNFLLSACQEGNKASVYSAPEIPSLSLSTATVVMQPVPRFYSATGYTNIARHIEVSTSQAGTIKQLKVNDGDIVKPGQLLIVIDESELITSIKQAKSLIKQARISLKDYQHDFNTAKRLRKTKIIPAEQLRKAQVQLNLAKSQLSQANNELKRQQARKPYYRITSPINAHVVKKWVNQGDLAVAGKPLLQLEALDELEFEAAVPVKWLDKIHVGDKYKLRLHDSDKSLPVKVSHIIHTANRITQTCKIKLALPNSSKLAAGLSGQIDFRIANEMQILIPKSALIKRAGVQGVFVVSDNGTNKPQAHFTPVKTERHWQKQWIILSGVQAGEEIVLNPTKKLRDGTHIKMANAQ